MKQNKPIIAKTHWIIFIPHILIILLGIVFGIWGFIGALTISFFTGLYNKIIYFKTIHLGFTNTVVFGIKGNQEFTFPLKAISTVSVEMSLFGRLWDYGTVYVLTTSEKYKYTYISKPNEFKSALMNAVIQYEQNLTMQPAQIMAKAITQEISKTMS